MKALLVRLSAIGDVVHTLPALVALHRSGWDAGWVVQPAARSLLEGHPLLLHLTLLPASRAFQLAPARAALEELRAARYDVAFELQGLWKSAALARLSGAPRVLGYASEWRREPLSALLLNETAALPKHAVHVIDKNLALLKPLGIEAIGSREMLFPDTAAQAVEVARRLAERGVRDFAVLNPGGGWPTKLWPPESYGALARALRERGLASFVAWGPGEEGLAARVAAASDGAAVSCFPTTLLELLELMRRARLVVAADTGPLHLACAAGTPVVGLYGPTDPARNGPFSPRDIVVRRVPLCAPCHKRRCELHDGVMEAIPVSEVVRAVERRLGLPASVRPLAV